MRLNFHCALFVLCFGCAALPTTGDVLHSSELWHGKAARHWRNAYGSVKQRAVQTNVSVLAECKARPLGLPFTAAAQEFVKVISAVCEHIAVSRGHVSHGLRWGQATDYLLEAETLLRRLLVSWLLPLDSQPSNAERQVLRRIDPAITSLELDWDLFEISALIGLANEALFWKRLPGLSKVTDIISFGHGIMLEYVRAGRLADAQRAYSELRRVEWPAPGHFPLKYFWDTNDFRRTTERPIPHLQALPIPVPLDEPVSVLDPGFLRDLRLNWRELADEARAGEKFMQEAYPGITRGLQWRKVELYTVGEGWVEDLCQNIFPKTCRLIRGRLRSEKTQGERWRNNACISDSDEAVGIFGVQAGGWAALHAGQDIRVNVHLCLVNCQGSRIVVGGVDLPYEDGGLFAFEDRVDHEVLNNASADVGQRLNLVIGVLHPQFDPDRDPRHCSWRWPPPLKDKSYIPMRERTRLPQDAGGKEVWAFVENNNPSLSLKLFWQKSGADEATARMTIEPESSDFIAGFAGQRISGRVGSGASLRLIKEIMLTSETRQHFSFFTNIQKTREL